MKWTAAVQSTCYFANQGLFNTSKKVNKFFNHQKKKKKKNSVLDQKSEKAESFFFITAPNFNKTSIT